MPRSPASNTEMNFKFLLSLVTASAAILGWSSLSADEDPIEGSIDHVHQVWKSYFGTLKNYRCQYEAAGFHSPQEKRTSSRTEGEIVQVFPKLKLSWDQWFEGKKYSEKIQFVYDGTTFQSMDYSGNLSIGKNIANCQVRPDVENPIFLPFFFLFYQAGSRFQSQEILSFDGLQNFRDIVLDTADGKPRLSMVGKNPVTDAPVNVTIAFAGTNFLPQKINASNPTGERSVLTIEKWASSNAVPFPEEILREEFRADGTLINEMRYRIKSFDVLDDAAQKGVDFRIPVELARQIIDADNQVVIKAAP